MKLRTLGLALAALPIAASCAGGARSSADEEVAPTGSAPPSAPVSSAGPSLSVESSCENEYPLVLDPASMSVIATAQVANDGDESGEALVSAQWFPVGLDPIRSEKTVDVPAGEVVRVPFKVKPSQSAINGMVGLQAGDEFCRVEVESAPR